PFLMYSRSGREPRAVVINPESPRLPNLSAPPRPPPRTPGDRRSTLSSNRGRSSGTRNRFARRRLEAKEAKRRISLSLRAAPSARLGPGRGRGGGGACFFTVPGGEQHAAGLFTARRDRGRRAARRGARRPPATMPAARHDPPGLSLPSSSTAATGLEPPITL